MDAVSCVIRLPEDDRLVTASHDKHVRIYCSATSECLSTLAGHAGRVQSLAALGGSLVASGDSTGELRVWDVSDGACLLALCVSGEIWAVTALNDRRFVLGVGSSIVLVSHNYGREVAVVGEVTDAHDDWITSFGMRDERFGTSSCDQTAALWDVNTLERLAVLRGHESDVMCIALGSLYITTGSADNSIRVFDAVSFQLIRLINRAHGDWVKSLLFVDDNHIISGGRDFSLQITDLSVGERLERIRLPFGVDSVCVTHRGWIVAAGENFWGTGRVVVLPPPPAAAHVDCFREAIAALRRTSCRRIVQLAVAVLGKSRDAVALRST
jgi:WD40 repeat protein